MCERAASVKKEKREHKSRLARLRGEVMGEGAMRALVAEYISPALYVCALFTCNVELILSFSAEEYNVRKL